MENEQEKQVKRKGSLLEDQAELIFKSAGFDVKRNNYVMGYEIDLFVSFGDRKIIVECKQYEKSYLPVKNLILQWKGKNEIIRADGVILIIYGVEITEEEHQLANDSGIIIWNLDILNSLLPLINDRKKLCSEILNILDLKERDIAETNEYIFKRLICEALLMGKPDVEEERKYEIFRKALRHRIITLLKEYGSTTIIREKHANFFENIIKDTETKKKFIIFKVEKKLSEKSIWMDIRTKLGELKPFDDETNSKYLSYMQRIEEGYQEYYNWFYAEKDELHQKLVYYRISDLGDDEQTIFYNQQNKEITVKHNLIILGSSAVIDINILEWILTDMNYHIDIVVEEGKPPTKKVLWLTENLEETSEFVCRILHEYFGVNKQDTLFDKSLIPQMQS